MKFLYKESCKTTDRKLKSLGGDLFSYLEHLTSCVKNGGYEFSESAINLPSDKALLEEITSLAKEKRTKELKYIFLIGIGGSNLGSKALYEAMYKFSDQFEYRVPKIFFLDTVNSRLLITTQTFIREKLNDPKEFIVITTTKSGKTTETATNVEVVFEALSKKFTKTDIYNRMVVITDKESPLWNEAKDKNISTLSIPKMVAGRNSVLSPTGLFPMTLAGLWDTGAFLKRAEEMRDTCLINDIENNPALLSALITYHHYTKGKTIVNSFFFNSEFESVGRWYTQLLAESVGKKHNSDGVTKRIGVTPTVSIGSTDLHSVLQLYLDGPDDKLTTFVWFNREGNIELPEKSEFGLVDMIEGKTSDDVISAIYEATKRAYKKEGLPFVEVVLEDFSDLGAFMQFKIMEVMYLAKLLGVNAFDQPAVEYYKKETRNLLEG
ncbi:hypothetical protein CL654_03090 [bacterium]|nr:hypothetical protein [bacterium]|tara:strand:+ start:3330 stop:4637 length:1308 start_codon:yes stop_codon:yes gene_type:complete